MNRIFLEPLYRGGYGDDVVEVFGAHGLTGDETESGLVRPGDPALIAVPTDFAGINHYTNTLIQHDPSAPFNEVRMVQVEPAPTTFGWSDTPHALRDVLLRVRNEFTELPIYVTENGAAFFDYPTPDGEVRDPERVHYLDGYTRAVADAVAAGADVRGYFAWSFLDNFEWSHGFSKRFGLVYVDYPTQRRIPKQSAYWYRDFIAQHTTGRTA